MICLNSIIELIGRISTMLRIFRASTPVESFLRGGQDGGDVLFVVMEVPEELLATLSIIGGYAGAVVRVFAGLHLVDEVSHGQRVILPRPENQRLLLLVDQAHEELHPVRFAFLDLDNAVEVCLGIALASLHFALDRGIYSGPNPLRPETHLLPRLLAALMVTRQARIRIIDQTPYLAIILPGFCHKFPIPAPATWPANTQFLVEVIFLALFMALRAGLAH
jgi:hypothetical protein